MPKKPLFSRAGKAFGSFAKDGPAPKPQLTPSELQKLIEQGPEFKREKNLFLAEDLSVDELLILEDTHSANLNDRIFNKFKPQWNLSKKDAIALQLEREDQMNVNVALTATDRAHRVIGMGDKIDSTPFFNKKKHAQLMCLYAFSEYFLTRDRMKIIHGMNDKDLKKNLSLKEGDTKMVEAIKKFAGDGTIINILQEAEGIYADVAKLADKYSVRLGDGKYFVASDDVQIAFRDPSDHPAWAIWFMKAVPLNNVPDRAKLVFLPEEERKKHYPEAISDRPIVCHASLWQLGQVSGVLLHTSWNHISVSYRWKIDKPIEIASLLFKAVAHPAHIARNFGYAPQMRLPGEDWF